MSRLWAITAREFQNYFITPMGYIVLIVFVFLSNWLFLRGFFVINQADYTTLFSLFPAVFLFVVPAVTMRLFAEERKLGTLEVLLTLPLRDEEVLLGKYLAALGFLTVGLLFTAILPLTGLFVGNPDPGRILAGYIGSLFLGGAYLAIGTFASSITESQIVAFILGVVFSFLLFIVGEEIFLMNLPEAVVPFLQYLGLGTHFDSIARGVIDSRDIIYYLSVIGFFLYLSRKSLELKR